MPTQLLPDPVAAVREALLAQASITALVSTRIYDRIPATPTWPLLVVSSVDDDEAGGPENLQARVQVDCWGQSGNQTDTAQARLIVRTVRSVSRDLAGTWPAGKIRSAVGQTTIPSPDPESGRARFFIDLLVDLNP